MAIRKLPGGKYQHDYRLDGRRMYKRFSTKAAAEAYDLQIRNAKAGGTLVDTRKGGKIRFHDLFEEWIARIERSGAKGSRPASPVTVDGYRKIYERHIKPEFEHRPLAQIGLPVVNAWLRTFATDDARKRSHEQLGRMLQFAVDSGYIATNVARNTVINNVPTPEPVRDPAVLGVLQLKELARQAAAGGRYEGADHDSYRVLVLFAGTTGLRWSEVAGLRVDALTFGARPEVIVRSTLVTVNGRLEFRETTKGRKPRKVPIPPSVAEELEKQVSNLGTRDLVFTSPSGAPLRSSNFARRVFHPAIQRCQEQDPSFPRIVFHDLRRTAVSLAVSGGTNIKVVQQLAGHKSAVTTLDVYAQYFDEDAHSSALAVDALLQDRDR